MQNANTKHRHSFKELKRMFDADKLSFNYLLHNVSEKEWHTFVTGIHDNVQKHFPDGTMLSKKQLKILRAHLFIVRCSDKEKNTLSFQIRLSGILSRVCSTQKTQ